MSVSNESIRKIVKRANFDDWENWDNTPTQKVLQPPTKKQQPPSVVDPIEGLLHKTPADPTHHHRRHKRAYPLENYNPTRDILGTGISVGLDRLRSLYNKRFLPSPTHRTNRYSYNNKKYSSYYKKKFKLNYKTKSINKRYIKANKFRRNKYFCYKNKNKKYRHIHTQYC